MKISILAYLIYYHIFPNLIIAIKSKSDSELLTTQSNSDYYVPNFTYEYNDCFYWYPKCELFIPPKVLSKIRSENTSRVIPPPEKAQFGDVTKELEKLKEELFKDKAYSTASIRSREHPAYSKEFLFKQLKLSKLIALEDHLEQYKKENPSSKRNN